MSRTDLDATGLRSTWVINPPLTAWPTDDDLAQIVDAYDPSILLPTTRPSNHSRRSSRSLRTSRRCASVWQPSPTKSPKPSGDRRFFVNSMFANDLPANATASGGRVGVDEDLLPAAVQSMFEALAPLAFGPDVTAGAEFDATVTGLTRADEGSPNAGGTFTFSATFDPATGPAVDTDTGYVQLLRAGDEATALRIAKSAMGSTTGFKRRPGVLRPCLADRFVASGRRGGTRLAATARPSRGRRSRWGRGTRWSRDPTCPIPRRRRRWRVRRGRSPRTGSGPLPRGWRGRR